jgi:hypothetical protein
MKKLQIFKHRLQVSAICEVKCESAIWKWLKSPAKTCAGDFRTDYKHWGSFSTVSSVFILTQQ